MVKASWQHSFAIYSVVKKFTGPGGWSIDNDPPRLQNLQRVL
ncbi:hypothetical protein Salpa_1372 [Sporomusa sp. KB1]|nr:hypothetical protein Salpa_1372 [Sporomusa sp. KB1]